MKHPGMLGFPSYLCQIQASEHTSITSGERMEDHKTCYGLYGQTCPRLLQKALPCEPCIKALLPFILTATAKLACQVKADFSQFPPPILLAAVTDEDMEKSTLPLYHPLGCSVFLSHTSSLHTVIPHHITGTVNVHGDQTNAVG